MTKFKVPSASVLKRRNERFAKLSKAEKRIAICKDMLKAIEVGLSKPTHNVYQEGPLYDQASQPVLGDYYKERGVDQELACSVSCQCCQIGGLLLAAHRQGNGPKTRPNEMDKLKQYFSEDQLNLMEQAFEGHDGAYFDAWIRNDLAISFAKTRKLRSAKAIQIAICKNVIRNNGTFVPSDMRS